MERIWCKLKDFINYSVSNDGLVRNDKLNRLKSVNRLDRYGYPAVDIYEDGVRHYRKVHRLVVEAFIDNPENKPQVNHIDGNKRNNNVSNLEWATASENMKHAYNTGLWKPNINRGMLGKKNPNAGRHGHPIKVVETGETFDSIADCELFLGIDSRRICDVLNGNQKSTHGYSFERI